MLSVLVISRSGVLFEGAARQVIVPGEQGVFEVGMFHKPVVSRLLPGSIIIDGTPWPVRRGVVQVGGNRVLALVEEVA